MKLEDYEEYVNLKDPESEVYLLGEKEVGKSHKMNDVGPTNNYSFENRSDNPFQRLILYGPHQVRCLVLTPEDEKRLKKH